MRTFSYWLCFALVPAHVLGLLLALLPLGGIVFPGWSLFELLFLFSSLIPRIVAQSVPYILAWLLYLVMLAESAYRHRTPACRLCFAILAPFHYLSRSLC